MSEICKKEVDGENLVPVTQKDEGHLSCDELSANVEEVCINQVRIVASRNTETRPQ